MDPDGSKQIQITKRQGDETHFLQGCFTNAGDVLSSAWLRRYFSFYDAYNGIILGSRYRVLWYFKFVLALIYFTYETFK